MQPFTSGRLAKQSGVNLETIRFYERQKLLPSPPRTAAGYRLFPAESVQRVRFIRRAQLLGFSLKEIKDLLALSAARGASCATVRRRAHEKIAEVEQKIAALQSMHRALHTSPKLAVGAVPRRTAPSWSASVLTRR